MFGPAALRWIGREPLGATSRTVTTQHEDLVCKLASSAAHVAGRPLCSSETCTWLGEHGHVPLDHVKAQVDLLFTLGINHVFFHGTPFLAGGRSVARLAVLRHHAFRSDKPVLAGTCPP
jgi:hypothetical protein